MMWFSLAFAWVKTRFSQISSGAIGAGILIVLAIVFVSGSAVWIKGLIVDGAVAGRDLIWTRTISAARDKARLEQLDRDASVFKAADDARAELELQLDAQRERTAEREQEIARMKTDPVCIPADMDR